MNAKSAKKPMTAIRAVAALRLILVIALLISSALSECFLIESTFKTLFYLLAVLWCMLELGSYFIFRKRLLRRRNLRMYLCLLALVLLSLIISSCFFAFSQGFGIFEGLKANASVIIGTFTLMTLGLPHAELLEYSHAGEFELFNKLNLYFLQPCALLMGIFPLIISLASLSFTISYDTYPAFYLGVHEARLWGLMNPNIEALFYLFAAWLAYVSLVRLPQVKSTRVAVLRVYLLFCMGAELFFCLLQQSRGAALLAFGMILALALIHAKGKRQSYSFVAGALVLSLLYALAIFAFNHAFSVLVSNTEFTSYNLEFSSHKHREPRASSLPERFLSADSFELEKSRQEGMDPAVYGEDILETRLDKKGSTGRRALWQGGLKMFLDHPYLGLSPQGMQVLYPQYFSEQQINNSLLGGGLHNLYLSILVSMGLPGAVLFVSIWIYLIVQLRRQAYAAQKSSLQIQAKYFIYRSYGILFVLLLLHGQIESILLFRINLIAVWFWFIALRLVFHNSRS